MTTRYLTGPVDDGDEHRSQRPDDEIHEASPHEDSPLEDQAHHEQSYDDEANEAHTEQPHGHQPHNQPPRGEPAGGQHRQRRRQQHIPSRDEIRATLNNLPMLVAKGTLSTAQVNCIHAVLRTLLADTDRQAAASGTARVDASRLRDAVHTHPEILDALAPLLSDEQLADLVDDDQGDRA